MEVVTLGAHFQNLLLGFYRSHVLLNDSRNMTLDRDASSFPDGKDPRWEVF